MLLYCWRSIPLQWPETTLTEPRYIHIYFMFRWCVIICMMVYILHMCRLRTAPWYLMIHYVSRVFYGGYIHPSGYIRVMCVCDFLFILFYPFILANTSLGYELSTPASTATFGVNNVHPSQNAIVCNAKGNILT